MRVLLSFVLISFLFGGNLKAQEDAKRPPTSSINTMAVSVMDMEKSIEFYQKAFGFEVTDQLRDEGGNLYHVGFNYLGKTILMIGPETSEAGLTPVTGEYEAPFNFYVYVDDVDGFHAQAWAEGAEVLEAPADQFWGDRTTFLRDINGYKWMFATYLNSMGN